MIIHLTTNTEYAEQQSQKGRKVTARRYKTTGRQIKNMKTCGAGELKKNPMDTLLFCGKKTFW